MNQGLLALSVALGGGVGALVRFQIGKWIPADTAAFPTSTFIVNMAGCLLIGWFYILHTQSSAEWIKPLIIIGFLGGLTTFSSFGLDVLQLFLHNAWKTLTVYVLLSNVVGIFMVYLGMKIADYLVT
jgi:CrcB protein